jgi:hypothetical protein
MEQVWEYARKLVSSTSWTALLTIQVAVPRLFSATIFGLLGAWAKLS